MLARASPIFLKRHCGSALEHFLTRVPAAMEDKFSRAEVLLAPSPSRDGRLQSSVRYRHGEVWSSFFQSRQACAFHGADLSLSKLRSCEPRSVAGSGRSGDLLSVPSRALAPL